MHYVYILKSLSYPGKYYIGKTSNLKKRFRDHNSGQCRHTQRFKPWDIKNYFAFKDKKKAFLFERYLKSGSGRVFTKLHL